MSFVWPYSASWLLHSRNSPDLLYSSGISDAPGRLKDNRRMTRMVNWFIIVCFYCSRLKMCRYTTSNAFLRSSGCFWPPFLNYEIADSHEFSLKRSVISLAHTNHRPQCSSIAQTRKMALLYPVQPLVSTKLCQFHKYRYLRHFLPWTGLHGYDGIILEVTESSQVVTVMLFWKIL